MSRSQVVRLEDASNPNATLRQLNRLAAANGYKLVVRAFPDADPIRDVAHARLLERLRRQLVAPLVWRPEVPLPEPGDLRGWDSNIFRGPARVAVEAETRIRDGQALERRLALKVRDDPRVDILVLLVADTAADRRAVPEIRGPTPFDAPCRWPRGARRLRRRGAPKTQRHHPPVRDVVRSTRHPSGRGDRRKCGTR